jgi:hypothetical protein
VKNHQSKSRVPCCTASGAEAGCWLLWYMDRLDIRGHYPAMAGDEKFTASSGFKALNSSINTRYSVRDMEWIKSVERFLRFLTSLIPGSAIFIVFLIHSPRTIEKVWAAPSLGYQSKVALILAAMFAAGWTLTAFLNAIGGAIGGAFGANSKDETQSTDATMPWFNRNWRARVAKYLAEAAPKDLDPVFDEVFQQELAFAEKFPEPDRSSRISDAYGRRSLAALNALQWKGWWSHYHVVALNDTNPDSLIAFNLADAFASASLVILVSAIWTPSFRHWWILGAASFWVVLLVTRVYATVKQYENPWSSFGKQMELLQNRLRDKAAADSVAAGR